MAGDAPVDRSDGCSSTFYRCMGTKVSRTIGHTRQYRMTRHTSASSGLLPLGELSRDAHSRQPHVIARGAHGLHIELEEINSQHVIAQRRTIHSVQVEMLIAGRKS